MTIQDVIDLVDSIEPNAYSNAQKAAWINECEGKVYTQLFLVQPYDFKAAAQSLALPAPYDRMYSRYLQAMIHYADGEYNRYQNSYAMFNEVWAEANRWFGGDFDVTDRLRNRRVDIDITQAIVGNHSEDTVILDIPEGCAFAAGRICVRQPMVYDSFGYVLPSGLTAGTYSFRVSEKSWSHFTLVYNANAGDVLGTMDHVQSVHVKGTQETVSVTAGESGTRIEPLTPLTLKMADAKVCSFLPLDAGITPLPMLMADAQGEGLTISEYESVNNSVGWLERESGSKVYLTGRLLIPADRWYYDDQYARRRDARWRG